MGVVKAMVGFGRSNGRRGRAGNGPEVIRQSTLEDGLRHVMSTIDNLVQVDERLGEIETDLLGDRSHHYEQLPDPADLGLDGFVPRLMEASLLISALSRRMNLRMSVIESSLGRRARPVVNARATAAPATSAQPVASATLASEAALAKLPPVGATPATEADGDVETDLETDADEPKQAAQA